MTFRARFLALFSLAVLAGSGLLAWGATRLVRQQFQRAESERVATLAAQFQRELAARGEEVSYAMQALADAEGTLRMALDLGRPQADPSVYANDARGLAMARQLDFLDLVTSDSTLISSAEWPARSGYTDDWVTAQHDWNDRGAFLKRVDLPDGADLGLLAVREVSVGDKSLYLIGGRRLDRSFLQSVALPPGMRALLYRNRDLSFVPEDLAGADGAVDQPERFAALVQAGEKGPTNGTIQWAADPASAESFAAFPLTGRQNEPVAVVLLGSTQRDLAALTNNIFRAALLLAAAGILVGIFLSSWVAERLSKPLERVTAGVRQVTAGNWGARVDVHSSDEAGKLAQAFNEMTTRLSQERARLVQTERVAAWRDVAQRVTHEVKQSLFPLEVTLSSLTRARAEANPKFGEILTESLAALRSELDHLKAAVTRFSDFAKMPQPRCKPVDVNELLRAVLLSFEPQFRAVGRPPITPELSLAASLGKIQGDPDLLRKAFENLLLHSIDTMPAGGTLSVRTTQSNGIVRIQISGSGAGFGMEKTDHPFSAFRARQSPGAGLGLPTTQAVVSDHGGRFFAESIPGVGTTFCMDFAVTSEIAAPAPPRMEAPRREIRRELPEIPEPAAETTTSTATPTPAPKATSTPTSTLIPAPTLFPAPTPAPAPPVAEPSLKEE